MEGLIDVPVCYPRVSGVSSDVLTGSYFAQSQVSTSPLCALMVCCAAVGAEMSHILRVLSPTKQSCKGGYRNNMNHL